MQALIAWLARGKSALCAIALYALSAATLFGEDLPRGREIYQRQCAACHGAEGEGTQEHFARTLTGDRSVAQLASFISKSMPPDAPDQCVGADAQQVAAYIHDVFYSADAQARRRPPRIELARLTARQYAGTSPI